MKKIILLTLILLSNQSFAVDFSDHEATGELIENETKIVEFCSAIKNVDDRCQVKNLDDFMLAAVVLKESGDDLEVANVIISKAEFEKNQGKKVKAKFEGLNPIGTVVEVF